MTFQSIKKALFFVLLTSLFSTESLASSHDILQQVSWQKVLGGMAICYLLAGVLYKQILVRRKGKRRKGE